MSFSNVYIIYRFPAFFSLTTLFSNNNYYYEVCTRHKVLVSNGMRQMQTSVQYSKTPAWKNKTFLSSQFAILRNEIFPFSS